MKKCDSVGGEIDGIFDDFTSFSFSYANPLMTGHAVSEAVKQKALQHAKNMCYQATVEKYQWKLQKMQGHQQTLILAIANCNKHAESCSAM